MQKKAILIAVGGATCSGKTTLAKKLQKALPNNFIIHQDDFAPSWDKIPYHPNFPDIQDWDRADTAIDWPYFRRELEYAKKEGEHLPELRSHDHLNKQVEVPIDDAILTEWRTKFQELEDRERAKGIELIFVLVDGFLLYYDPDCTRYYDALFFLRVPYATLKQRREERAQYVTQTGDVWQDPPHYFDNIVYPAYVDAHRKLFTNQDVEKGELASDWYRRVMGRHAEAGKEDDKVAEVFTPAEGSRGMQEMVAKGLERIYEVACKRTSS
ncbi:hypothetical protein NliqN6_1081 [Naganishia liquefaciens]|uniref:P-loop containing nucleoside triphosphate hydrolase protein n=1 Tax=Naganishia liquefaciens TaxID=104408 RepID=A0A8H3TQZ0_9TREE|nr:hypothetical protein NliqN6_1081 [Naganishia liquefaciens]